MYLQNKLNILFYRKTSGLPIILTQLFLIIFLYPLSGNKSFHICLYTVLFILIFKKKRTRPKKMEIYIWTICYIILNTCKSVRRHVFCYCISKTKKTSSDKIRKKTLYWPGPVNITFSSGFCQNSFFLS